MPFNVLEQIGGHLSDCAIVTQVPGFTNGKGACHYGKIDVEYQVTPNACTRMNEYNPSENCYDNLLAASTRLPQPRKSNSPALNTGEIRE